MRSQQPLLTICSKMRILSLIPGHGWHQDTDSKPLRAAVFSATLLQSSVQKAVEIDLQ
jgi:hypothetical protein